MGVRQRPVGGLLWPSLRAFQVWGANTDVGKTVVSTMLCISAGYRRPREGVRYIKPVSTGPQTEDDSNHVKTMVRKAYGTNEIKASLFDSATIVHYDDPVSPHIAALNSQDVSNIR
jgi:bifunctional dethiobiotin synthetase / adenosylmethionine---8-amino-7-oxononanoate aminotransferase